MTDPNQSQLPKIERDRALLLERYDKKIRYYWTASARNKRWYKSTRILVTGLSALVTFVAAISSAQFVEAGGCWDVTLRIVTPALALALTVLSGLSQNFQWGAAWGDMVLNATILEGERDRIRLSETSELDFQAECAKLNGLVLQETEGFFERVLGRSKPLGQSATQITPAAAAKPAGQAAAAKPKPKPKPKPRRS